MHYTFILDKFVIGGKITAICHECLLCAEKIVSVMLSTSRVPQS